MAECSFRLSFDSERRCPHPVQRSKSLCRWHDSEVKKTQAEVEAAVADGLDLTGADLRGAHLTGADLRGAHLWWAELTGTELSGADLTGAHLTGVVFWGAHLTGANLAGANLPQADLMRADLMRADLRWANLRWAVLTRAVLTGADLTGADLRGADLSGALLGWTVLADCDLSEAKGLESVRHARPSSIGVDTIFKSKGNIPPAFLQGAGVPDELIRVLPRLLQERRYYTTFICYGEPDRAFAEKLESDLRSRGVPCWIYFADATPGERTWREIGKNRREAGRMIVLCSAAALIRDGVLKEIEEQIDEDPDKMVPVSLDNLWKADGFRVMRGNRDLRPFLLDKNYADFSDPKTCENALSGLLRALETGRKAVLAEGES